MSGMLLASLGSGGASGVATYVTGIFADASGSSAVLATLGIGAGDFALFGSLNSSLVYTAGGSWTDIGTDGAFRYFYRQLNSVDVSGTVTYSADCVILFYRGGVASAARRSTGSYSGANPVPATGFAKNAKHMGLAAFAYANGGAHATPSITAPATWTIRGSEVESGVNRSTGYDRLSPTYVDSTAFSATFNSTTGGYTILELMSA